MRGLFLMTYQPTVGQDVHTSLGYGKKSDNILTANLCSPLYL